MNNSSSINSQILLINTIKSEILASCGILYIIIGSIGTILNLVVLTDRSVWSLSPCIPYMFASSLTSFPFMYVVVLSRIGIAFQVTPFYYNSILCKLQVYIADTSTSLMIWFIVGSTWDRYLSSSRNAAIRRISSMRNTRRTMFVITVCILVIYAQIFVCFEGNRISAPALCSAMNTPCSIVDTSLIFLLQLFTPSLIIFYFVICILMNIRQLKHRNQIVNEVHHQQIEIRNNREADQTIERMLLIQVFVLFICSLPNFAFRVYTTITLTTPKSNVRLSLENLIFNGILLIFYFDKIFSFYIYTMSSRHFRKILWQVLTSIRPHRTIVPEN